MSRATLGTRTPDLRFTKALPKGSKSKGSAKRKPSDGATPEPRPWYRKKLTSDTVQRIAHALAYDMSVAKALTPRQIYEAQTEGCKSRFDEQAKDLAKCLRAARLILSCRRRWP